MYVNVFLQHNTARAKECEKQHGWVPTGGRGFVTPDLMTAWYPDASASISNRNLELEVVDHKVAAKPNL